MAKEKTQTLSDLLEKTKEKVLNKDYYETRTFTVNKVKYEIHFKLLSHKIYAIAGTKPVTERIEYILNNTLYNPQTNKLFTEDQLKILFEGLGGLTENIAMEIIKSSGFDMEVLDLPID